jgi:hypothetical protein
MITLLSRDFTRVNGFSEHEPFLVIDCLRENNAGSEYAFQIPFLVGANGSVVSFILTKIISNSSGGRMLQPVDYLETDRSQVSVTTD